MQENWNEFEKCGIQEITYITLDTIATVLLKGSPYTEALRVS